MSREAKAPRDSEAEMLAPSSLFCMLQPDLLHALILRGDASTRAAALDSLVQDQQIRVARAEVAARARGRAAETVTFGRIGGQPQRTIYDQLHQTSQSPGRVARSEGQAPVADRAVNEAYDGLGHTYMFYWTHFERD